ncbi:hmg-i/hmg-y, DNA-binding protein [Niveomyces insectorum RCEF 264]|uniref:Hmg-i/hmg-y, DNA-binding protein n=1 Tax=Niveomyces insectorum RCEF 264 TaxID=1081102 RepID=A0A167QC30_9HYPO|nr:hmg-i/hmg-y, DNA-binding protein [Niveomyces insectorum RCEF 264]
MNTSAASFTPLESLLLFQSILKYGFDADAFVRISATLKNNAFLRSDHRYNADRLRPESLQQLFLHLFQEELVSIEDDGQQQQPQHHRPQSNGDRVSTSPSGSGPPTSGSASPTASSRKRKLPNPSLSTLHHAHAHVEHLPTLVERLYARYRDHVVAAIREDEQRIEKVQKEIAKLEREEQEDERQQQQQREQQQQQREQQEQQQRLLLQQQQQRLQEQQRQQKAQVEAENARQREEQPASAVGAAVAASAPKPADHPSPGPNGQGLVPRLPIAPVPGAAVAPTGGKPLNDSAPPVVAPTPISAGTAKPQLLAASPRPGSPAVPATTPTGQRTPITTGAPLLPATTRPAPQAPPGMSESVPPKSRPPSLPPPVSLAHKPSPPSSSPPVPPSTALQPPPATQGTAAPTHVGPSPVLSTKSPGVSASQPAGPASPVALPPPSAAPQRLPPNQPLVQPKQQQQRQQQPPNQVPPLQPAVRTPQPFPGAPPVVVPSTPGARPLAPSVSGAVQPRLQTPQQAPRQPGAQLSQAGSELRAESPRPVLPASQKPTPAAALPLPAQQQQPQPQQPQANVFPAASAAAPPPSVAAVTPGTSFALPPHAAAAAREQAQQKPAHPPSLPEHVRAFASRTPTPVQSPRPGLPHTPLQVTTAGFIPRGSGTRWKSTDLTPSTPGPDVGDMPSPAYEPLSPVRSSATARIGTAEGNAGSSVSPTTAATLLRQPRHLRRPHPPKPGQSRSDVTGPRPRGRPPRLPRHQVEAEDSNLVGIKNEVSTPRAFDDGLETPGEETTMDTRSLKRKRDESVDFVLSPEKPGPSLAARRRLVGPSTPPTHVLWMRGFPKISSSALDQISSHRYANMFAHKIRDRDAPGYGNIVRHPVDLKSIRMAISQGNKAATAVAASLPESDQAGASVWLPISEDLVPPRGIINSSQLESELVHMFANAIMYNPDSHRGPGPAFMACEPADDDHAGAGAGDTSGLGGNPRYQVDEDGVVNDTRDMYVEVEKLLSEMRSAEKQRGVPPPPPGAKGLDLPIDDADVAALEVDNDNDNDNDNGGHGHGRSGHQGSYGGGGGDEKGEDAADGTEVSAADTDAEGSGTVKRRRIMRGQ